MLRKIILIAFYLSAGFLIAAADDAMRMPVIDGDWWQVAGNPDLGDYTSDRQQPVDFGVWQARDGTWQLWSCIRHTKCGGCTRLFYRWEGKALTDRDWTPKGIAMEADTALGETHGGMQAPHVVKYNDLYYMAYGDWVNICFATSIDGKNFKRVIRPNGKTGAFSEGPAANTRDPMLLRIGNLWHCYYTASSPNNTLGYISCRTSPDLQNWGPSCVVCYGGMVGDGRWITECPHVVSPEPGWFYLFRNQYYGTRQMNFVYRSKNPLHFCIDDDSKMVCALPVAAPEIIHYKGQYYMAALNPGLDGIRIARLSWIEARRSGRPVFDFDKPEGRAGWKIIKGDLPGIFWTDLHADFRAATKHVIGTSEIKKTSGKNFDDALTGIIVSPVFTLKAHMYQLFVGGGRRKDLVYVAIEEAETGRELARFTGRQSNVLSTRIFRSGSALGKRVRIKIVDLQKDGWGHINFGGMVEMGRMP